MFDVMLKSKSMNEGSLGSIVECNGRGALYENAHLTMCTIKH